MVLFPPGKGGGDDVGYGRKGKGVTQHLLVDGEGMPMPMSIITTSAGGDERAQVINLLAEVQVFGPYRIKPKSCPKQLQGDKGYDSQKLRVSLRSKGIQPLIPRRVWPGNKQKPGRKPPPLKDRFKVERCFAWIQRKFRRLCIRWERRRRFWDGFIELGTVLIWMERLLRN